MKKYLWLLVPLLLAGCTGKQDTSLADRSAMVSAVELDGDANGATDISKGGTNATTDSGARTALGVPAIAATLVGDCTVGPCLDGTSDGGTIIYLYGPNGFYQALQAGASVANRSWRLPIDAAPGAGTTRLMNMDEYGQMGFVDPATFQTALTNPLVQTDVDDAAVDGVTTAPISSNWAYDHVAAADPHTGYVLESALGTSVGTFLGTPSATNFWSAITGEGAFAATLFGYADAAAVRTGIGAEPTQTAASQAEAEAGTEAAIRSMSPLRVFQAIAAYFAANVDAVSADVETMMGSANNAAIRSNIGVAAKYVSGTEADFYNTLFSPQALYAISPNVTLIPNTPAAFTITAIRISCDADPTTEQTLTIQHKAAGVGYGSPTTIEAVVTTAGVANITSGIDDATIPANVKVFATLSDPDDALTECAWQIEGDWD